MLHLCCWVIWCQDLTEPNDRTCQDAVWSCVSLAEFEAVPKKVMETKVFLAFVVGLDLLSNMLRILLLSFVPPSTYIISGHIIVLSTCKSKVPVYNYTRDGVAVIYEKHYLQLLHLVVLQLPIWFLALTFEGVIIDSCILIFMMTRWLISSHRRESWLGFL